MLKAEDGMRKLRIMEKAPEHGISPMTCELMVDVSQNLIVVFDKGSGVRWFCQNTRNCSLMISIFECSYLW